MAVVAWGAVVHKSRSVHNLIACVIVIVIVTVMVIVSVSATVVVIVIAAKLANSSATSEVPFPRSQPAG